MLSDELALRTKLSALDIAVPFSGVTMSLAERRESLRAGVKKVPDVIYTVREGKRILMRHQFEAVYGEAL